MSAWTQERVTRVYDRLAPLYDLWSAPMERLGLERKRRRLLAQARGRVLEAGIGTARNLDCYPAETELSGIDISPRMIERARRRASRLGREVDFRVADVTALPFAAGAFDTTTATCLFCSVPDPVAGLRELGRVTRPEGRVLLLEHVRPAGRLAGALADAVSPLTARLFGPSLNRRTEEHVREAGLEPVEVRRDGIWREIVARPAGDRDPA